MLLNLIEVKAEVTKVSERTLPQFVFALKRFGTCFPEGKSGERDEYGKPFSVQAIPDCSCWKPPMPAKVCC